VKGAYKEGRGNGENRGHDQGRVEDGTGAEKYREKRDSRSPERLLSGGEKKEKERKAQGEYDGKTGGTAEGRADKKTAPTRTKTVTFLLGDNLRSKRPAFREVSGGNSGDDAVLISNTQEMKRLSTVSLSKGLRNSRSLHGK